jgi:FkbM family methyltransferase
VNSALPRIPEGQLNENTLVWEFFGRKPSGFFVEVGANDPFLLSQSWMLEQNGWIGVLVEPLAACCADLRRHRKARVVQGACVAPGQTGTVTIHVAGVHSSLTPNAVDPDVRYEITETAQAITLTDVLLQAAAPDVIDFLSIDTEGTEGAVLAGLDLTRFRPTLILVEDHVYSLALHRQLNAMGYKLIRRTGVNNWYVPKVMPFALTAAERWLLFRKMYLGTPLRVFKLWLKRLRTRDA